MVAPAGDRMPAPGISTEVVTTAASIADHGSIRDLQTAGLVSTDGSIDWFSCPRFDSPSMFGALGFIEESVQFRRSLQAQVDEHVGGGGRSLNAMYRIDGASDLKEALVHCGGYCGSRPVRVGNGVADQLQLDSLFFAERRGLLQIAHRGWASVRELLDRLTEYWDQSETGIWGPRGTKVLHRRAPDELGRVRLRPAVRRIARAPRSRCRLARCPGRHLRPDHGQGLEPAVVGVHPAQRRRGPGLLGAADVQRRLHRSTGLEDTFSLCSFMCAAALARASRLENARLAFGKILPYADHVELCSEEIALAGSRSATSRKLSPTWLSSTPRTPSTKRWTGADLVLSFGELKAEQRILRDLSGTARKSGITPNQKGSADGRCQQFVGVGRPRPRRRRSCYRWPASGQCRLAADPGPARRGRRGSLGPRRREYPCELSLI